MSAIEPDLELQLLLLLSGGITLFTRLSRRLAKYSRGGHTAGPAGLMNCGNDSENGICGNVKRVFRFCLIKCGTGYSQRYLDKMVRKK